MLDCLLYFLTVLIWGTTWFAIKLQIPYASPEVSIFYRFIISAATMLAYCWIRGFSLRFKAKDHLYLAAMGLLIFSVHYVFLYTASFYLVSGLVSVIFSMASMFNILNAFIFFRKKPDINVILGAFLGVIGVALFFWNDFSSASLAQNTKIGFTLAAIGTVMFSLGSMVSLRNQQKGLKLIPSITIGMTYGCFIMFLVVLITGSPIVFPDVSSYWYALFWSSIPGTVIAFLCYLTLVNHIGPEKAGYATILFPAVALIISYFLEDYRWTLFDLVGFLFIITGNCLIIQKRRIFPRLNRS